MSEWGCDGCTSVLDKGLVEVGRVTASLVFDISQGGEIGASGDNV